MGASLSGRSKGDPTAQRTSHGKRKNPPYDAELEPDKPGSEGAPDTLQNPDTAPSVIPVPRASATHNRPQRRRRRRQGNSGEDFTAKESEGVPLEQRQGNGEAATSSPGQDAQSAVPAANPPGSSHPTCWLCRGPASPGRLVELVALDRGAFASPSSRGWASDVSDFSPNMQKNQSYSVQPVAPPASWETADVNAPQFQLPRFPVGGATNDQGDVSVAWPVGPYGSFGSASSSVGFPGSSVSFAPIPCLPASQTQNPRGYGCHPVSGQDSALLTPFDGALTAGDNGFMGPAGSPPAEIHPKGPDASRMSRS